jgi:hypothetical protein
MIRQVYGGSNERLAALVDGAEDRAAQSGNFPQYFTAQFFPRSVGEAVLTAAGGPVAGLGLRAVGALALTRSAPLALRGTSAEAAATIHPGRLDAQTVNASVSSGFTTLGVDRSAAKSFLGTPTGNDLLATLSAADPSASPSIIRARAFDLLATGAELPKAEILTSPLVKIVPAGQTVTPYSPFFTTRAELTQAAQSGRTMADWFGLPLRSEAPAYSIYEIAPTQPAVVFSNRIAPTTEFGGRIQRSGLGLQVLVPNRSLWSPPSLVGTIRN